MNAQRAKLKRVAIFLASISAASIPAMVHADWSIKGLGTLGGRSSVASGINDSGQVVGVYETASGNLHAFITGPNGTGMTDLDTLGGAESFALGINDSGQVVGGSLLAGNTTRHAFITGPNGMGMTDLGTLGGRSSFASGINDSGQVVGSSYLADNITQHAFITGPNGIGMTDLGTLDNARSYFSSDINNSGQVVGYSILDDLSPVYGFITGPNGMGMADWGTFGGYYSNAASGINDSGEVVGGAATAAGERHAFIFSHGEMTDLSLLAPVVAAGWTDISARSINNNGQIVGFGHHHGNNEVFLLSFTTAVPEPETYLMLLTGLGLIGYLARRRRI